MIDQIDEINSLNPVGVEKMEEYVNWLRPLGISELVREQDTISFTLDRLEEIKKEFNKIYDLLRLSILPDKMDDEGITTVTVAGTGRATIQSDIYFSISKDNRDDAHDWLRNNGHGDVIKETVNSSTGKALAKELIKKGEDMPSDLFKVTPFSRVQITRASK